MLSLSFVLYLASAVLFLTPLEILVSCKVCDHFSVFLLQSKLLIFKPSAILLLSSSIVVSFTARSAYEQSSIG